MKRDWIAVGVLVLLGGCSSGDDDAVDAGPADAGPEPDFELLAVTFNTGTTEGLRHDDPPDDGYGSEQAAISDMYYGDGLAWVPAVDATRAWFAEVSPDVVAFQEIFHSDDCAVIPPEAYPGFVCDSWSAGDPTVANVILGMGYQVACNFGKPDKCLAVKRSFGAFRGCDADLCLDGLDGAMVDGCGSGSRIGRGVIDMAGGGALTVVNIHGTSGITVDDMACRVRQFDQVFVELGDGSGPAANGEMNLVMGDLNTDPGRLADGDTSAARITDFVGQDDDALAFRFISPVGPMAPPTTSGLFNIDHIVSDVLWGTGCWAAGVTEGHPAVYDGVYFDHAPVVCDVAGLLP